jgi:hypothetical protein
MIFVLYLCRKSQLEFFKSLLGVYRDKQSSVLCLSNIVPDYTSHICRFNANGAEGAEGDGSGERHCVQGFHGAFVGGWPATLIEKVSGMEPNPFSHVPSQYRPLWLEAVPWPLLSNSSNPPKQKEFGGRKIIVQNP